MATPAAKPLTLLDDDDDLWDFSTPGGVRTPEQSPARSSGNEDEDELKALPTAKRRKLMKLTKRRPKAPDLVLHDTDSEAKASDSDLEIVEEIQKARAGTDAGADFDILGASATLLYSDAPKKISRRDAETELALLRNRAALEQARKMVAEPLPEYEESPERARPAPPRSEEREPEAAAESRGKIVIKLSTKQQADPIKLRINKDAPFSKMFQAFREFAADESRQWITENVQLRFVFDGDVIQPGDTADSMEVEEDCVIEVFW